MATPTRLAIGATIVLSLTAYWACLGASSSWQYYLTVDECVDGRSEWSDGRIRVSGRVAPGSLRMDKDRRLATFRLKGVDHELSVHCSGTLPDNLTEGCQVVVEGWLDPEARLQGEKVLTRCASKYASALPDEAAPSSGSR